MGQDPDSVPGTAKPLAAALCTVTHGITLQLAHLWFWLKLRCHAHLFFAASLLIQWQINFLCDVLSPQLTLLLVGTLQLNPRANTVLNLIQTCE